MDGPETSFAVSGDPVNLARLRNHLVTHVDLTFAREQLEHGLSELASPGGLPVLKADDYRKRDVDFDSMIPEGTTLLVTREFTFDSAHNLPRYHGKCEFLHGHTFKIEVTVRAPLDPWSGMSFDFHDLKGVVKSRVVDVLDHSYLNERIPNPSAECIALWAWRQLEDLPLHEIKIWETPTSHVTYQGPKPLASKPPTA
jgi:6-pyruvoyltetrahydropterin/6-carboxytetrahydropterin synthase